MSKHRKNFVNVKQDECKIKETKNSREEEKKVLIRHQMKEFKQRKRKDLKIKIDKKNLDRKLWTIKKAIDWKIK